MNYIISESQSKLLTEQKLLVNIINSTKFINSLASLTRAITRGVETVYEHNIKELELIQSLIKQSLAGGQINISEKDMEIIRNQQKMILNSVANELGYDNWTHLKESKVKEINKKLKQNKIKMKYGK